MRLIGLISWTTPHLRCLLWGNTSSGARRRAT